MTMKDLGPDPISDTELVTRGFGDGRYLRSSNGGVKDVVTGTQAQYDSLSTKVATTFYVIV